MIATKDNDTELLDYLEVKCQGHKVMVSKSRVTGLFSVHACAGYSKGVYGVRAAIARAIEAEKERES